MARRYPDAPAEYDPEWAQDLIRALNQEDRDRRQPRGVGFSTANVTKTRAIDGSSATLDTTRNVLATLIQDLIDKGFLKD